MTRHYRFPLHGLCTSAVVCILSVGSCLAQWTTLPGFVGGISFNASAYLDGRLYSFGGVTTSGYLKTAQSYNPTTGLWAAVATMSEPRFAGYAGVVNGKAYLIGGVSNNNAPRTYNAAVLEYDPSMDKYTTRAAMPVGTAWFAGATVGNTIFMIGGATSSGATGVVWGYDATTDTWWQYPDAPYIGYYQTATAIGDTIYLIGGMNTTSNTVVRSGYKGVVSNRTINWTPIANYPLYVYGAASGVVNGRVYVAGGIDNATGNSTAASYSYDPATNKWSYSYPMPRGTYYEMSLPSDGSSLYYPGGYQNSNIFKLNVDKSVAVAVVGRTDFLVTVQKGEQKPFGPSLRNDGVVPLDATVEIPSGAGSWLSVSNPSLMIQPGDSATIPLTADASKVDQGEYRTTVLLHTSAPDHAVIPIDVRLYVRDHLIRQKTNVVIEEECGNWCGWCRFGDTMLVAVEREHPEQTIVLAYHGPESYLVQDPFYIPGYDSLLAALGSQWYPNASIQRWYFPGQSVRMTGRENWLQYVDTVLTQQPIAPVAITIDHYNYSGLDNSLSADVHITTSNALSAGDSLSYRMMVVLTEDSMKSTMSDYGSGGGVIDPYYSNHVVRAVWPDQKGKQLDISADAIKDAMVLPGTEIVQNISLSAAKILNPDHAHIAVLVFRMRNGVYEEILQGYEGSLAKTLSVTTEQFSKTVGLHDTASFRSIVKNIGNVPSRISLIRTENALPEKTWQSWFCVNGYCYRPDQDSAFSFLLVPGDSAIVDLHVFGASGGTGHLTLRVANDNGEWSNQSFTITTLSTSSVDERMATAGGLSLAQNLPNPASGITGFPYTIPAGNSSLDIFTLTGEKVLSLRNGYQEAGTHTLILDMTGLSAGTYVAWLSAGGASVSRLITVMR